MLLFSGGINILLFSMGDTMNFESTKYLANNLGTSYAVPDYLRLIYEPLFESLIGNDLKAIKTTEAAGNFFGEHATFINAPQMINMPVAAIDLWLRLLERVEQGNPAIYSKIHKGTPYYHAGIYCLFATKYLEAFEWLGYAFEQDIKDGGSETPAIWLLSFDAREGQTTGGAEYGKTKILICELESVFKWINLHEPGFRYNVDTLRGIVKAKILIPSYTRSLLSAWSSLLTILLTHRDILRYLRIAPSAEEAQITVHNSLSNLTLIFETLIKENPTYKSSGLNENDQLGEILEKVICPAFSLSWDNTKKCLIQSSINKDYENILSEILVAENSDNRVAVAFTVSQRVRNKAHHLYHEKYINEETFDCLYYRIVYAIMKVIFRFYGEAKP
jgi:hypothetical protein